MKVVGAVIGIILGVLLIKYGFAMIIAGISAIAIAWTAAKKGT